MTNTIRREILFPQPRERVWAAIATSTALAEWMFPNNFEPRVGHCFTFRVPANPKVGFDGMIVNSEVLECDPPRFLAISWCAEGVGDTRVQFLLEPEGTGTRLVFEHSGFDISRGWSEHAIRGAEYGWAGMLKKLPDVVAKLG